MSEPAADQLGSGHWYGPEVEPVASGIHRIPLPLPGDALRAVNVYLIEAGADLVLIDGGWATAAAHDALLRGIAAVGRDPHEITHVCVTHVHRDHYTLAVTLREAYGAALLVGAGERPSLEVLISDGGRLDGQLAALRAAGAEPLAGRVLGTVEGAKRPVAHYELPDAWLAPGQRLTFAARTLEVVPTPGHTRGHVVFVDRASGLLFAGDHVLPHITPSIGFEPAPTEGALDRYLSSLRLVLEELPDLRLLPAHGPVSDSVHGRVVELQAHHEVRLAAADAEVGAGRVTAYDVARRLPWTARHRRFDALDTFNQMLAVLETSAHLDVLVRRGRLARCPGAQGGVTSYARRAPVDG